MTRQVTRDSLQIKVLFGGGLPPGQFEIGEHIVPRSGWLDGQEATVEVVNSQTVGVSLETGLRVVVEVEGVEKAA